MCHQYLGSTVTIHAGGIDHIPVHHTNEIAQSETASGQPLAKIWLHSNFILIDGQKMAKSRGNIWRLEDIEAKGYCLEEFKLVVLASRYQTEANFTWTAFQAARLRYQQLCQLAVLPYQPSPENKGPLPDLKDCQNRLKQALEADLNSPLALSYLDEVLGGLTSQGWPVGQLTVLTGFLEALEAWFGLGLLEMPDLQPKERKLFERRAQARQTADWGKSDRLRDELKKAGVGLKDTGQGQLWFWL